MSCIMLFTCIIRQAWAQDPEKVSVLRALKAIVGTNMVSPLNAFRLLMQAADFRRSSFE